MVSNLLERLVSELDEASSPLRLVELADRLGVEPTALNGMIRTLEWKGMVVSPAGSSGEVVCASGCGATCTGVEACPFVANLPRPVVVRRKAG